MRVLVPSSRVPSALETIRRLGRAGHTMFATDTSEDAPGNHSRFAAAGFATASPIFDTKGFIDDIERIVTTNSVELVVPTFEEVFALSRHRTRLDLLTELFAADFEVLKTLHDKAAFLGLVEALGLPSVPRTIATSRDELAAAAQEYGQYFARAAFSRSGQRICTNAGPLANKLPLESCDPSPENPYVVQPYVSGHDICTYSVVHHGRVAAHVSYVHTSLPGSSYGMTVRSIEAPETLALTQAVCEATGYHGQISLDFMHCADGLKLVECNPRPSAGLGLMPAAMFEAALLQKPPDRPMLAPAGARRKLALTIIRNILEHPNQLVASLGGFMRGGKDIEVDLLDPAPFLYQLRVFYRIGREWRAVAKAERSGLIENYMRDITWNGDPLG